MRSFVHNVVTVAFVSVYGFATEAVASEPVPLTINQMFSPSGFDDNDNIQIVVDGWLQSSCDTVTEPKVTIHAERQTIEITAQAIHSGFQCLPFQTRFTSIANLGVLPWGWWEIVANNGQLTDRMLIVEATNSGPDDDYYAQVDHAYVDYAPELMDAASRWSIVLEGTHQSSCQSLEEVKVIDSGDTFEVLPILTNADEAQDCLPVVEPFVVRAFLPVFGQDGRYLLHVRSRDGEAINRVFSVVGG